MSSFTDLPNEILEKIAEHLDSTSLAAFAQVSTRCRDVLHRVVSSLRFDEWSADILALVRWHGCAVRSLDLSNSQATSGQLEAIIVRCTNLAELSVVNTRLTMRTVLSAVQLLRRLETVRFGLSTSNPSSNELAGAEFPLNDHLRRVYVEVPPEDGYYAYAIDFVNACTNIEWVHLFVVDSVLPPDFNYLHFLRRTRLGILAEERWSTLHTILVSSEARDSAQRLLTLVPRLFEFCPQQYRITMVSAIAEFKALVFERGLCNTILRVNRHEADEEVPTPEPRLLRHLPQSLAVCLETDALQKPVPAPGWGVPQGLAVSFHPTYLPVPFSRLTHLLTSHLTELNLTKSHWRFPETAWWQLIVAAPALQALAIPACFLPSIDAGGGQQGSLSSLRAANGGQGGSSSDAKRLRVTPSAGPELCVVTNALSELPLKQLHIRGDRCRSCITRDQRPKILGKLCELPRLESLTLVHVPLSGAFLDNLWSPTVMTLRLVSVGRPSNCEYLLGLSRFIQRCTSLRHLKLEHEKMPLHSTLLWAGLSQASGLSQLCLSSNTKERIDLAVVAKHLTRIRDSLRHLHVHGLTANHRQQLKKCLKSLFATSPEIPAPSDGGSVNPAAATSTTSPPQSRRTSCTVLVTSLSPFTPVHPGDIKYPLPGRSICFSGNFIGHVKPEGWEFH
ncbi:hypothetical protein BIW11_06121 [Tropilaelaps mercedesae]|uniref:F-box domain-containing protein n=1 Tax=Tropilaelaps mercedesae TaxID=418985 RepID=A0A1V9XZF0_9ACAR|nr:hypothetical protein BIW11_06121 [Tropilaelaps mercedesae]